ncbi:hypothetical protein Tco_0632329 [Tanacetum coccineum]
MEGRLLAFNEKNVRGASVEKSISKTLCFGITQAYHGGRKDEACFIVLFLSSFFKRRAEDEQHHLFSLVLRIDSSSNA